MLMDQYHLIDGFFYYDIFIQNFHVHFTKFPIDYASMI